MADTTKICADCGAVEVPAMFYLCPACEEARRDADRRLREAECWRNEMRRDAYGPPA